MEKQLEDLQRGFDSMTVDAFHNAKITVGQYSHLSEEFRRSYHKWLDWCHCYCLKDKSGVRYRVCRLDEMTEYYRKERKNNVSRSRS